MTKKSKVQLIFFIQIRLCLLITCSVNTWLYSESVTTECEQRKHLLFFLFFFLSLEKIREKPFEFMGRTIFQQPWRRTFQPTQQPLNLSSPQRQIQLFNRFSRCMGLSSCRGSTCKRSNHLASEIRCRRTGQHVPLLDLTLQLVQC